MIQCTHCEIFTITSQSTYPSLHTLAIPFFFSFSPSVVRPPKIYPLSKFKYTVQYCQLLSHRCTPTLQDLSCITEALYLIFTFHQTLVTTFLLCISMILASVPFLLAFYKSELEYSQSTGIFLHVMSILWKNVMCISGTTLTSFFLIR